MYGVSYFDGYTVVIHIKAGILILTNNIGKVRGDHNLMNITVT